MSECSLQDTAAARQELLCLYSWFNQISSRDPQFSEVAYRILAAEKRYQLCLHNLRQSGICQQAVPYRPGSSRRGIALDGCWFGW